ncbi:MAG: ribonuclease III [Desulfobacterales bacterium]|nr:ribonuclease III [Desulfobacterales bacterium]
MTKKKSSPDPYDTGQIHPDSSDVSPLDLSPFEKNLKYRFKNIRLLEEALRHSSFVNERPESGMRDNERLEFLGDAVLNLTVGHILMDRYPYLKEGDLSRTRAGLVNETQLAEIARKIDMGTFVRLGKGERQTEGMEKKSILANTFEAVVAAIYLDSGLEAVFDVIDTHFSMLSDPIVPKTAHHDYKSRLQELVQTMKGEIPLYDVIHESGPDHDKTFSVQLTVSGVSTKGVGKSKKLAEQDAAQKAFELLEKESADS